MLWVTPVTAKRGVFVVTGAGESTCNDSGPGSIALAEKNCYLCGGNIEKDDMHCNELEIWWSSLPVTQKERIARKALTKTAPDGIADEAQYRYPACTCWWNGLDEERKQTIHDHCVDRHGYLLHEWNNADPYGD